MSFQVENVLKGNWRKYLDNLTIYRRKEMTVSTEISPLAVPDWELSHDFKIIYQHHHKS